jgi:protein gp37
MAMGTISKIQWTNATYEPVLGCTRASTGCENCYAEELIARRMGQNPATPRYHGLAVINASGQPRWTGKVVPQPDHLGLPLHWKKPRRVFVCSRSDLFHPKVKFEYIAAVFGVMSACPQHTFLVLTKRPERARDFFGWLTAHGSRRGETARYSAWSHATNYVDTKNDHYRGPWPLPNVHLGVSVESQEYADERIPLLVQCPAAVHWISAEPLLGPIELRMNMPNERILRWYRPMIEQLDWIVVGGESTHIKKNPARPCNVQWIRSIVQQCKDANVACFVKQLGSNAFLEEEATVVAFDDGTAAKLGVERGVTTPTTRRITWKGKGDDRALFPKDLQVFEYPEERR